MEQQRDAHPRTPRRWVSRAALLIAVGATILVIGANSDLAAEAHIALVAVAAAAYLAMLAAEQRWGGLTLG
jgi:hypothetical protein